MNMDNHDIAPLCVLGTGLSGLTQAAALAHHGFDVTLIGPTPEKSDDGRTTAVLNPGIQFLKTLELWQAIKPHTTPLATMELVNGTRSYLFDASEVNDTQFGFNIPNAILKQVLTERLAGDPRVTWHTEMVTSLEAHDGGWILHMPQNRALDAGLLIAADGRNSPTRQAAHIDVDRRDENQSAIVAILQTGKAHGNTSVEWYHAGGPMTLVPMPQNRLAVVWCDRADIQQARMAKSKTILGLELTELTRHRFGALKIIDTPQLWPVMPMKAHRLIAPHTALIGEAAHILAPIGAQGFNLSIQDIMALTAVLRDARTAGLALHDMAMLRRYQQSRLPDIIARWRAVNALNDMIRNTSVAGRILRRLSMDGIIHTAVTKRLLMHLGMGQAA